MTDGKVSYQQNGHSELLLHTGTGVHNMYCMTKYNNLTGYVFNWLPIGDSQQSTDLWLETKQWMVIRNEMPTRYLLLDTDWWLEKKKKKTISNQVLILLVIYNLLLTINVMLAGDSTKHCLVFKN